MAKVLVSPAVSMADEDVAIVVNGLQSERHYALKLSLTHRNGTHESSAVFRSDHDGNVDLTKSAPIRGSYRGVEPMGLFMTMVPAEGYRFGSPIVAVPTSEPFIYKLSVTNACGTCLATVDIKRYFEHPEIERIEIENDTLTGTIYKLKGKMSRCNKPLPAVIDLYGSSGGIKEHRAALLASHGFSVLCLPYFHYKELPEHLIDVDLDYFHNAIEYFCSLPYTTDCCGIIGSSLGGSIACLLAISNKKVKAIVPVNATPVIDAIIQFHDHGELMPFVRMEEIGEMRVKNGIPMYKSIQETLPYEEEMVFPIENSAKDTQFYFITSIDDESNCSVAAGRVLWRSTAEKRPFVRYGRCVGWPRH